MFEDATIETLITCHSCAWHTLLFGPKDGNSGKESLQASDFLTRGWCRFAYDERLASWVERTLPAARAAVTARENAKWLRCGGTWFVGVNALPNDEAGAVAGGPPLAGRAVDFICRDLGLTGFDWDRAQVSVVYSGYPQPMSSESAAAFRYRYEHDAAHVDGFLREGSGRRRYLRSHHAFILGIPMAATSNGTSPFVVWENSHELVRRAFRDRFREVPPAAWRDEDVTELYHAVRREIFAVCERIELVAQPGEAYLVHRLALHGIAPWSEPGPVADDGRMIVYFRPEILAPVEWLTAP